MTSILGWARRENEILLPAQNYPFHNMCTKMEFTIVMASLVAITDPELREQNLQKVSQPIAIFSSITKAGSSVPCLADLMLKCIGFRLLLTSKKT